jgi:hypothetical protein
MQTDAFVQSNIPTTLISVRPHPKGSRIGKISDIGFQKNSVKEWISWSSENILFDGF